jgi:hypothetical protein
MNIWTCERCLARVLTIDQKQQLVDDSEQCLAIFNHNKDEFFRRYITMDEKWLLHYTLQSPIDSQPSELNAMNRIQSVESKVMASLFWDARGILFNDYLEKGQTIKKRVLHSV